MDIYTVAKADAKTEIRSRRTAKAKVFQLPDGKGKRHLCFGAPIHYWTPKGEGERPEHDEYDDIDIRLQHTAAEAEKTFGNYLALKNTFTYGFRDDGKAEKYIGIRRGADNQMEWSLLGVKLGIVPENESESVLTDKTVPTTYTSAEKVSDFQFKHVAPDYEVITDFNEVHIRTAIKTAGAVDDFLIKEQIDLKGITLLNRLDASVKGSTEYVPINGEFRFETTDGHLLWIPTPKMWTEDPDAPVAGSNEITHRLYKQDGKLIYEKYPTDKGKEWLASIDGSVFIDGDTYTGTTADGYVGNTGSIFDTWSTVRNAASGDEDASYPSYLEVNAEYPSTVRSVFRSFLYFDTSAVGGTVTSCSLFYYPSNIGNRAGISVQLGTQNSSLGTGDYDSFSGTYYAYQTPSINQWNELVFSSQGCSDINVSGVSKICLREKSHDYDDSSPSNGYSYYVRLYSADDATRKPYLDIVEPTASSFVPKIAWI